MPEGVRLVISRRLERLGDEARRVLTAAAVIGRSFPLDILLPSPTMLRKMHDARRRSRSAEARAARGAER